MIRLAVCDDEPYMLDDIALRLSNYMKEKKLVCRISCFSSGRELLDSDRFFDFLFLDIRMESPNGMEIAKLMRHQGFTGKLIFITVLKELVFDAFEVEAFDYLVKPLQDEKLFRTMDRALEQEGRAKVKSIVVQKGADCQVLRLDEILYCEVMGRKIYLHKKGREVVDYYCKLKDLEQSVDSCFFRCHRSYLVNLDYVREMRDGMITLSDGEKIPVSRLREQELSKALLCHMKERSR